MSHCLTSSSRKRQLWKIAGESSIWSNYPTKPIPDKLSRLFLIETEDVSKYEIVCSSFNTNGNKLAVMDQRGNIHEFDFKTFKCQTVCRCGVSGDSMTYSPKYNDITVALHNKQIHIFECGQYKLRAKIKTHHQDTIHQLQYTFMDNNRLILMSCSSDIIILWDINNNYQQLQSLSHNYSITFGLLSPSFEAIVTCFANDVISFWDWKNYTEKYELCYSNKQTLKEVTGSRNLKLICGDVDHKNGLLVVGGRSRYIYLWVIKKKLLLKCIVLPLTIKHVLQLKFLQNHTLNIILALGDDGQIVAVNHKTLDIVFYIQRSSQFIQSFAVSDNNKKISCVMSDGTIEIMSIKSLSKRYIKKCIKPELNSVTAHPSKLSSLKELCDESELHKTNTIRKTLSICNKTSTAKDAISSKLSVDKLRDYLLLNGAYADKYRLIIWKFLLNLPNLQNVYTHYQQKGNNKKWMHHLQDSFDCKNIHLRSKQRLLNMLSLLSNWCALWQYVEFLPSFILPFTNFYKKNDMECFECISFILCRYCSEWFVDYPNPPIKLLSFWVSTLKYFDATLYQHFHHHSISIEHHLWHIIRTGFSSFFKENDWLSLWDHIISNDPLFFHVLPLSIVICCKNTLCAMHSQLDIATFFQHQQQLYLKNIINKTYFIIKNIPKSLRPIFNSVTNPIISKQVEQYPIFNRYPHESLIATQHKYMRHIESKQDDKDHAKILKSLQKESEEIAAKQAQFAQEQRMMDYLYKQRLSALQFEEHQHAVKQKEKSDEVTQTRLESLGNIQQTMKEMLDQQNVLKQITINDVENQIIHQKKISKIDNDRFKNSTALNQLESDIENKLHSIHLEQSIKAQTLKLQRLKHEFDKEQQLKHKLLEQTLKTKDAASKYKFIQQKRLLSTLNTIQNEYDTEQKIKHKLKLESIVNDQHKKEIEEENQMTDVMNEQLNITKNMIEKQKQLQDILTNQEQFETEIMTDEYRKFKQNIKSKHANVLKTHKKELLSKLNEQQIKFNTLSKQQRLKQFETTLKNQENCIQSNISQKEQQLQETIDLLQHQIKHLHGKQMEIELVNKEMLEENAFGRIAKDAEAQIINEEKEKYATMREQMLNEMQTKEESLRERHEAVMNKLMKDREKQLLSIGQNAKDNASTLELKELEKQYKIKREELNKLQESYNERQNKIRHQILGESNIQNTHLLTDE